MPMFFPPSSAPGRNAIVPLRHELGGIFAAGLPKQARTALLSACRFRIFLMKCNFQPGAPPYLGLFRNSPPVRGRSEARRVGKGGVRTCRSRWSPVHKKKKCKQKKHK